MAANRHLSSSALLVVLAFLLAALPGLYLFQAMVHKARSDRQHPVANLVVRLNDRTPHHLDLTMEPVDETVSARGRVTLAGIGTLRGGEFPWKEAPIEGRLELELNSKPFVTNSAPFDLTTGGGGISARYQERYLGSADDPLLPVPCLGQLKVSKVFMEGTTLESWSQVTMLQGLLELQCHGSGRDLEPNTADDLHFTLLGTLDYLFGS